MILRVHATLPDPSQLVQSVPTAGALELRALRALRRGSVAFASRFHTAGLMPAIQSVCALAEMESRQIWNASQRGSFGVPWETRHEEVVVGTVNAALVVRVDPAEGRWLDPGSVRASESTTEANPPPEADPFD